MINYETNIMGNNMIKEIENILQTFTYCLAIQYIQRFEMTKSIWNRIYILILSKLFVKSRQNDTQVSLISTHENKNKQFEINFNSVMDIAKIHIMNFSFIYLTYPVSIILGFTLHCFANNALAIISIFAISIIPCFIIVNKLEKLIYEKKLFKTKLESFNKMPSTWKKKWILYTDLWIAFSFMIIILEGLTIFGVLLICKSGFSELI